MAEKKILGVLLPTTQFLLKLKVPPVREMIEKGSNSKWSIFK